MTAAQPDRLDRIEALVEANSKASAAASSEREELRRSFSGMQQALATMTQHRLKFRNGIDATQAEIRGMQVGNRRILDHLFEPNECPPGQQILNLFVLDLHQCRFFYANK